MMAAAAQRAAGGPHTHNSGRGLVSNKGARKTRSPARRHVFHVMGSGESRGGGGRAAGGGSLVRVGHHQRALSSPSLSVCVSSSLSLPATVGSGLLSSSLRRGSAASGQSVGQSPHSLCQWLAHTPVGRLCPLCIPVVLIIHKGIGHARSVLDVAPQQASVPLENLLHIPFSGVQGQAADEQLPATRHFVPLCLANNSGTHN